MTTPVVAAETELAPADPLTAEVPPPDSGVEAAEPRPAGEIVLDQLRDFLDRFTKFPSKAALEVATLWTAHTWVLNPNEYLAFDTSPRLAFLSDEPASGKTRALEMVGLMSHNGYLSVDPTPATFANSIAIKRQTALVDEIDILFGRGAGKAQLRSLMNVGYKSSASWSRANKEDLPIFGALAMAGLGSAFRSAKMLSPLRSRTIEVNMKRRRGAAPYRPREHDGLAAAIRTDVQLWVQRNTGAITEDWPDLPAGIEDRLAEVWEPLFMIANVAGGHWPESAWQAARELALGKNDGEPELPLSAQLIRDLQIVFEGQRHLSTPLIVKRLYALPDPHANWLALWPVEGAAPAELRGLLNGLGIPPAVKVWEDGHNVRGYKYETLEPLWLNLPPVPPRIDDSDDDLDEPV